MNAQQTRGWIEEKRLELQRCYAFYGPVVASWDLPMFLEVIDAQAREIRNLQTALAAR